MKRYAAGVLGWSATGVADDRLDAALAVAPWRGESTATFAAPAGTVHALGQATAVEAAGIALALHGRIDRLAGMPADFSAATGPADRCLALIEAYRRHGPSFHERVIGDFALVLVDGPAGLVLAARDWIGARPLFWGEGQGGVVFASDPEQVLALLGLPYRLDEATLALYARVGTPGLDATFALGVRALLPGGRVEVPSSGGATAHMAPLRFAPVRLSDDAAVPAVRAALDVAVRRRAAGAAHLGALVSGGMDSTSVAATASALSAAGHGPPLAACLTAAHPDLPECDETGYASAVARHLDAPWTPVPVAPAAFWDWPTQGGLERNLGPAFPSVSLLWRLIVAAEAEGVDVLLTGQLGDLWLRQPGQELRLATLRGDLRGVAAFTLAGVRPRPRSTASQLVRGLQGRLRGDRAERYFERSPTFWTRSALELEEREAMLCGIRVEAPFGDRELANLLAGLRSSQRSSPRADKLVLRRAMAGRLPAVVLDRRGYTFQDAWLEAALGTPGGDSTASHRAARTYAEIWRARVDGIRHDGGPSSP